MQRNVWIAFLVLAVTWGTSFMFIKIALEDLPPAMLVALRLTVGAAALLIVARWQKLPLPRGWAIWQHLFVVGFLGIAFPFVLISWAEQHIASGLTSVLNSTVPLFSILVAGVWLKQESVTTGKIIGLVLGFGGVVLLFARELQIGGFAAAPLAVILAGVCYAVATAYARHHLHQLHPIVTATGQVAAACLLAWITAFLFGGVADIKLTWPTVGAIVWLGLLGSALAYILFYYILGHWGPTRSALVTYVIPLIAVAMGTVFLNEFVDWRLIAGGALILSGVGAVNAQGQ